MGEITILDNYILQNNIFSKRDNDHLLSQIDTIVFDIDGVLVNVDASYYQTIRDTIRFYFERIIKIPLKAELAEKGIILNFKMIGGFNDDWELCAALILFYLWKMREYDIPLTDNIKDSPPFISDFINQYLADGGGLSKMVNWIEENSAHAKKVFSLWNPEQIIQIALEFYSGEQYCTDFYHFKPQYIKSAEGNMIRDTTLFDPKLIKIIRKYRTGIYTGRGDAETNYVLKKLGWAKWVPSEALITLDSGIKKPSPLGLARLQSRFQSKVGLYIGDTMDDFLTVENFNRLYRGTKFLSAIVTGEDFLEKEIKKGVFLPRGVDLLGRDVNQILLLLDDIRSGCAL